MQKFQIWILDPARSLGKALNPRRWWLLERGDRPNNWSMLGYPLEIQILKMLKIEAKSSVQIVAIQSHCSSGFVSSLTALDLSPREKERKPCLETFEV